MDNPGILRVLRSSPWAEPGVVSAPEQSGAESGHSSGQARPGHTASTGQGSVGSGSLQFCIFFLFENIQNRQFFCKN